jgi:hypothetical protein
LLQGSLAVEDIGLLRLELLFGEDSRALELAEFSEQLKLAGAAAGADGKAVFSA